MVLAFAFSPVAIDREANNYDSGIGPQAGGFSTINGASPLGVKTTAKLLFSKVTFAAATAFSSEVDTGSRQESAYPSDRAAARARRKRRIRPPPPRSMPGTRPAPPRSA